MDTYLEQLVKIKLDGKAKWLIVAILAVDILLTAGLILLALLIHPILVLVILGVVGFGTFKLLSMLSVEFEYIITNGDLDIDKITAKSTRKRILSVRAADVLRFGTYRESIKTTVPFDKIIDVTSGFETENTICFMTLRHKEHGNVLLIFEPKKEILDDLKRRGQGPFEA